MPPPRKAEAAGLTGLPGNGEMMQKVHRGVSGEEKGFKRKGSLHRLLLRTGNLQEFVSQEYLICGKSIDYTD